MVPLTWAMLLARARIASDIDVDRVGGLVALLFREDGLLFQERGEKFVRVLEGAQRQDARGIDLVENRDFAVEAGVARERILFEISDLRFDTDGGTANRADGGHGIDVCAVSQLDRRVLRLHTAQFHRVHSGKLVGAVRRELAWWT